MAIRTVMTDDLDGSEGAKPHTIGLDDELWAIDLTDENWAKVRAALEEFISYAMPATKSGKPQTRVKLGPTAKEVKAWADAQGLDYPQRGRLPQTLVDAFLEAN